MTGGLLPPFGEPAGQRVGDVEVITAFLREDPSSIHSEHFHVEGSVLVGGGDMATALRVAPRTFLLRVDLPPDLEAARQAVEAVMEAEGLILLDRETLLAAPIAIQRVGLRFSTWDLWGAQIDESFADLRRAAAGEWEDLLPGGIPPVGGPPD
ncbi:MAG: hypothetical protein ACRD0N_13015 [Acidimicrobiales bacterium]